jgi:nitroreductase
MAMTPSKAVFRSHLMQQFAAAACNQSRPPLAIAAFLSSSSREHGTFSSKRQFSAPRGGGGASSSILQPNLAEPRVSTKSAVSRRNSSTLRTEEINSEADLNGNTASSDKDTETGRRNSSTLRSDDSTPSEADLKEDSVLSDKDTETEPLCPAPLAASFQTLMTTRRTQSKFSLPEHEEQQLFLKSAIERAVVCAQSAPNHHKTEPFFFKRIMAPSDSSRQLADIAFHVVYQKKLKKDPEHAQVHATRKGEKWRKIPAFLVTLVKDNQEAQVLNNTNEYEPMEYKPPTTERQLEDYASACAAIQNVLLSLHAEDIGTKWATGPVIHTPAFRKMIGAKQSDRVIGLIMAGLESQVSSKRRFRNSAQDLLQDI